MDQSPIIGTKIKYCLYARKSTEAEDKQALSIDSQIKEMIALAQRDNLEIVEIKRESHSSKEVGQREVFNQMIKEIREGRYNGILTWAPDRLSRNAGDLGSIVDLMDQKLLIEIRTYGQKFTNNPNEKFLLMILGSQAKLENDNKAVNVKRGLRTRCEMGWRPGVAPTGYLNEKHVDKKCQCRIDPKRAPIIKQMFEKVANEQWSGRKIFRWLLDIGFKTKTGKSLVLANIYLILRNHFYYGEFEYPSNSGVWYKGSHDPIISRELFKEVQKKLSFYTENKTKTKWGSKTFDFKDVFKCAYCGASVVGEEKFKLLKSGKKNRHVYYHCSKKIDPNCPEPYVNELDLVARFIKFVELIETRKNTVIELSKTIKSKMTKYKSVRDQILEQQKVSIEDKPLRFSEFFKHIVMNGTNEEKQELLTCIKQSLYIHNGEIFSNPLI